MISEIIKFKRSILIVVTFILITHLLFANEGKPDLELSEVVINATAPILEGAHKTQIPLSELQNTQDIISTTLQRSSANFPDFIDITEQPSPEPPKGCLAPVLGSSMGKCWGTKGRLACASKAWEMEEWQDVVDSLMPIITRTPNDPNVPAALYFIGRSKLALADLSGAGNAFETLIIQYPDHLLSEFATYELGWIYLRSSKLERAVSTIDDFKAKFPNSPLMPYARYLKASTLYMEKNYKEAITVLEGIVSGYPFFEHLPQVQFWIAENQYYLGLFDQADKNYSHYIQNYPHENHIPNAYYGRAFCHLEKKQMDLARDDLKILIHEFPDHPLHQDANFQLGKISVLSGDPETAMTCFSKAAEHGDENLPRNIEARGWIAFEQHNFDRAYYLFNQSAQQYAEQSPENDSGHLEMKFMAAMSKFRSGSYLESAGLFQALTTDPPTPMSNAALANAGVSWMKIDNLKKAYELLYQTLPNFKESKTKALYTVYTAEILYRMGRYAESIELFRSIPTSDPELNPSLLQEIYRGIAWNLYSQQLWFEAGEAFGLFAQKFSHSPFYPEALLRQAECFFNHNDLPKAEYQFTKLIEQFPIHPESFEARLLLSRIKIAQEDYNGGQIALETAMKYAQDSEQRQKTRILMGELAQERKDFDAAIDYYQKAYLEDPHSLTAPSALLKEGDNLYNIKKFSDAEKVYRMIIEQFPNSQEAITAQYSIGLTYFQQNRLDDYLKECYQTASDHQGTQQSALALMGASEILMEQNRADEAIQVFRRLLSEFDTGVDIELVHFRLGQALMNAGKGDEASGIFNDLLTLSPQGRFAADAAFALAETARSQKKFPEAEKQFLYIISNFPHHPRMPDTLLNLAIIEDEQGKTDSAIRHLDLLIQKYSDSSVVPNAHLLIAGILIKENDPTTAKTHLDICSRSTNRTIVSESQFLEAKRQEILKNTDEALKQYLKIGYLYPDQKSIVFRSLMQAGEILRVQGKKLDAQKIYEKAKQKVSGPEDLDQVENALKLIR